jgi:hypothetical protein
MAEPQDTNKPIRMVEPPKGLFEGVFARLHEDVAFRRLRRRFVKFLLCLTASATALPFAVLSFSEAAAASGFNAFLSLIVTDSGLALQNWAEFGSSLLERLPITGALVIVGVSIIFLASAREVLKDIRVLKTPALLLHS